MDRKRQSGSTLGEFLSPVVASRDFVVIYAKTQIISKPRFELITIFRRIEITLPRILTWRSACRSLH